MVLRVPKVIDVETFAIRCAAYSAATVFRAQVSPDDFSMADPNGVLWQPCASARSRKIAFNHPLRFGLFIGFKSAHRLWPDAADWEVVLACDLTEYMLAPDDCTSGGAGFFISSLLSLYRPVKRMVW